MAPMNAKCEGGREKEKEEEKTIESTAHLIRHKLHTWSEREREREREGNKTATESNRKEERERERVKAIDICLIVFAAVCVWW